MSEAARYRVLPSVEVLLRRHATAIESQLDSGFAVKIVQRVLTELRQRIHEGSRLTEDDVHRAVEEAFAPFALARLRPVINATGVIIHTNLGRAPVSQATADAMREVAAGNVPLELDPETGRRGGRMEEVSRLFRVLTGAEEALVVNNNAAAVLLVLSAMAHGREVIISRGESIEIGGGFRIPDVLEQSGARLVEVGTTNRTRVEDYERAITEDTAALLKVHPSNFRITGFTASVTTHELVELGRRASVPVVEDLGSGCLLDTRRFGLDPEPTIQQVVEGGADLVTISGDKLLGGPQAGIVLGRASLVQQVARHPLARAVRADKTCLAGLAATLRHYVAGEAEREIPVWRMMSASTADLESRARSCRDGVVDIIPASVDRSESAIGGGALPGQTLPSFSLVLYRSEDVAIDDIMNRLRTDAQRPVYGRVTEDACWFDLRTVDPADDKAMVATIRRVLTT